MWTLGDSCGSEQEKCPQLEDQKGVVQQDYYGEHSFHFKQSESFRETGETMSIQFASGHIVAGKVIQDTVSTDSELKLSAKDFKFIVEEDLNYLITNISDNSGIMGLSPED